MQYIVHKNGYKALSSQQLRNMFDKKTGSKSYDEWMKAFCERKYNSDFSKEMTRSVMAYLKEVM
jgi:nitroreductase/FMN reductase (NADPH)/FMN reductase [NAD(P)H]